MLRSSAPSCLLLTLACAAPLQAQQADPAPKPFPGDTQAAEGQGHLLALSANGQHLLSASGKTARLWRLHAERGAPVREVATLEHGSEITSLSLSADARLALIGSRGAPGSYWRIGGEERDEVAKVGTVGEGGHAVLAWDKQIGFVGTEAQLSTFRLDGAKAERLHQVDVGTDLIVPARADGTFLLRAGNGPVFQLWHLSGNGAVDELAVAKVSAPRITAAAFTEDGKRLITGAKGKLQVWSLSDGALELEHTQERGEATVHQVDIIEETGFVISLEDAPVVWTWKGDTLEQASELKGGAEGARDMVVHSSGRWMVTGGAQLELWTLGLDSDAQMSAGDEDEGD